MCASCGCGKPNDRHDDQRHITLKDLKEAANAANLSVGEVVQNIDQAANGGRQASAK